MLSCSLQSNDNNVLNLVHSRGKLRLGKINVRRFYVNMLVYDDISSLDFIPQFTNAIQQIKGNASRAGS
jgi:hypothetical protein